MKKLFTPIFIILFSTSFAWAYPISPRPLRKLIIESEYIVVAHVMDLREKKSKKEDSWENFVAVLQIKEVLQGKITETFIEVPYHPGMICPAPPHFEKDTDVLVFLDKRGKNYYVHALSYGTKTLDAEAMGVYVARIKEMQQILTIEDEDERFLQSTDWLVKCAEHPATRHEGIYELSRESDFMSYYDQTENQPFQFALSEDQKARLEAALFSTPSVSFSELGLIDLIYPRQTEQVYHLLMNAVKAIGEDDYWMAGEFMRRLMYYKSNDRLLTLADDFDNKVYDFDTDKSDLKKILAAFVDEIEE